MTKKKDDGGSIFLQDENGYELDFTPGITLRDYFAGQAIAGMLADTENSGSSDDFASMVYR